MASFSSNPVFQRVAQMQALNDALDVELEGMQDLVSQLAQLHQRIGELSAYYQSHWQDDVRAMEQTEGLYAAHVDSLPESRYSILAEDPIWNTLYDYHQLRTGLLRSLRKK